MAWCSREPPPPLLPISTEAVRSFIETAWKGTLLFGRKSVRIEKREREIEKRLVQ